MQLFQPFFVALFVIKYVLILHIKTVNIIVAMEQIHIGIIIEKGSTLPWAERSAISVAGIS